MLQQSVLLLQALRCEGANVRFLSFLKLECEFYLKKVCLLTLDHCPPPPQGKGVGLLPWGHRAHHRLIGGNPPRGAFGRNPPSGGGAPIFSPSPPVGAGGRHGSAGSTGNGNGHAPAAGASSRAGSFLNPFGEPPSLIKHIAKMILSVSLVIVSLVYV